MCVPHGLHSTISISHHYGMLNMHVLTSACDSDAPITLTRRQRRRRANTPDSHRNINAALSLLFPLPVNVRSNAPSGCLAAGHRKPGQIVSELYRLRGTPNHPSTECQHQRLIKFDRVKRPTSSCFQFQGGRADCVVSAPISGVVVNVLALSSSWFWCAHVAPQLNMLKCGVRFCVCIVSLSCICGVGMYFGAMILWHICCVPSLCAELFMLCNTTTTSVVYTFASSTFNLWLLSAAFITLNSDEFFSHASEFFVRCPISCTTRKSRTWTKKTHASAHARSKRHGALEINQTKCEHTAVSLSSSWIIQFFF